MGTPRIRASTDLTRVDKVFLKEAVDNGDIKSESEAMRTALRLLRYDLGYSNITGKKESA